MSKFKKPAFYIGAAAGTVLVLTWLYLGYIQGVYAARPHQPRPEMGWTTPLVVKGATVYISATELQTKRWLTYIDMGLFAVTLGCMFFAAGPMRPRTPK